MFTRVSLLLVLSLLALKQAAFAETISLEDVLQKAVKTSNDLKISAVDIRISKSDVFAAKAEYLPYIKARMNIEKLNDLEDSFRPVVTVGDTVIPAGTRFQNSIGLTAYQPVWDFGVRHRKMDMAKKDVLSKTAGYDQTLRDLKMKVVDLYSQALVSYRAIKANEGILALAQQGYQLKKRLFEAGTRTKVEVADEAIQVAQTLDTIETLKHQLEQQLANISYYTHEPYGEDTDLTDIKDDPAGGSPAFDAKKSPEARQYTYEIEKKQKEIESLKRQYLPSVSVYSNYNIYGFDQDQMSKAFSTLAQRTVSVGLAINTPVFDGFRNLAAIRKAQLEKEKLGLQKEQKLEELKNQAEQLQNTVETHTVLLQTKATIVNKTQDKLTMEKRLSDQQLIDQTQAIQDHINRIQRQLDTEKSLIQGVAALKKLKIMAGS